MAGSSLVPLTGALDIAGLMQTELAASKIRLVTGSYVPTPADTATSLAAIEATYSGYTSGGLEFTTWLAPLLDPSGGASITSPQVQFTFVNPMTGDPVTNIVTGWFLVNAADDLVACGSFDNGIAMITPGDGFPISLKLLFGTLVALVQCSVFGQQQ